MAHSRRRRFSRRGSAKHRRDLVGTDHLGPVRVPTPHMKRFTLAKSDHDAAFSGGVPQPPSTHTLTAIKPGPCAQLAVLVPRKHGAIGLALYPRHRLIQLPVGVPKSHNAVLPVAAPSSDARPLAGRVPRPKDALASAMHPLRLRCSFPGCMPRHRPTVGLPVVRIADTERLSVGVPRNHWPMRGIPLPTADLQCTVGSGLGAADGVVPTRHRAVVRRRARVHHRDRVSHAGNGGGSQCRNHKREPHHLRKVALRLHTAQQNS